MSYRGLSKKPLLFRSFTGLTVSEFDYIYKEIESKYEEYERLRRQCFSEVGKPPVRYLYILRHEAVVPPTINVSREVSDNFVIVYQLQKYFFTRKSISIDWDEIEVIFHL